LVVCHGYRHNEVHLKIPELKKAFSMTTPRWVDPDYRPVVQRSLGCHVSGAALPHADPGDPLTMAAGVQKRIGAKLPTPSPIKLRRLRRFVRRWLRKNLVPLSHDCDVSVEAWLAKTHYPEWRKNELRKKWAEVISIWDHTKVKVHMKDETYVEYKHARGIYSREDEFKCAAGPIFKLIEEALYKDGHFIKHIPVAERGRYVKERLYRLGAKYFSTDYSTFEGSFIAKIMDAVEFELYSYMVQHLPSGADWLDLMRKVLMGKNVCEYKHFMVQIMATRMSGEMCTSLGNGFTNLMVFLFVCEENDCVDVDGVVEGDDGLFALSGEAPTSEQFAELGFVIKMEEHLELSHASFCGLIFDINDEIIVTDPMETIVQFGWVSRQYSRSGKNTLMKLLRCKSLSLAHQYPGCPIIQALAEYGLRQTRSYCVKDFVMKMRTSMWEREQLIAAIRDESKLRTKLRTPGMATRLLVESKFGIIIEHQLHIEKYLAGLNQLEPLDDEILQMYVKPVWSHYYDNYSKCVNGPVAPGGQGLPNILEKLPVMSPTSPVH